MRGWLALLIACAGCYRPAALAECDTSCANGTCASGQTCGGDGLCHFDGKADCSAPFRDAAAVDSPMHDGGVACRGSLFTACAGSGTLILSGLFSTSGCSGGTIHQQATGLPDVCVLAADDLQVQTVRITGPRPLVLVANTIEVEPGAVVDVASHLVEPNTPGAGANPATCAPPSTINLAGVDGGINPGGGGGGGSFQSAGGGGGASKVGGGRSASAQAVPTYVIGGCNGGNGGNWNNGAGATAGSGGGALYMIAMMTITVDGSVNASGAAAAAPGSGGGGAGGGAGGLIAFDAPSTDVRTGAQLFALGGGGSSGGTTTIPGAAGGESAGPTSYASGGGGGAGMAGAGGAGSSPLTAGDGGNGSDVVGGGGGGGGGGFVIFFGSNSIANPTSIAPPQINQ